VLATLQNRFAACPSISLGDLFSFWDMMSPRLYSWTTGGVHRQPLSLSAYVGFGLFNKRWCKGNSSLVADDIWC
jgi:hypothetical protein